MRSAVLRANAPPQLARGDWLPTSPHRSAHLQPEKTGLPGFPAPLPTWTRQRKEIPRRCSEIFAVKIPGSSLAATRRLTGGSRGSASAALTAPAKLPPRPACPRFRLSPPPFRPARLPEKCFAVGSDHTPHNRRWDAPRRSSLHTAYRVPTGSEENGDRTAPRSGQTDAPFVCSCAVQIQYATVAR